MNQHRRVWLWAAGTAGVIGVGALSASGLDTPGDAKPAGTNAGASGEAKKPEFPRVVKKKLYAKNDYRGKLAPKFEVEKWLSDEPKREGKVVLVDFWATWCPPCRKLVPELEGFKKAFGDDLVVIGVSDENAETVSKFIREKSVTYPMAIDTKARMKDALDVEGIPHVMIVDSTGIVRWQGFPGEKSEPLTEAIVRRIIEADKARRENATPAPTEPEKPAPPKEAPANTEAPVPPGKK